MRDQFESTASRHPSAQVPDVLSQHCRELARSLPLWPAELADDSIEGRRRLLARLRQALRSERIRGLSGHWAYDLARHAALLAAYRAERDTLMERETKNGPPRRPRPPVMSQPKRT